ncbi:MAG: hypothetical protein JWN21_712 [Sphingomonas bacterium]|uniref:hypothetical protein n=1 Tax=Sphingomonas bacterium TaxID=1895847 RepID=UPI00261AA392|nr:hypothetical protein [Sphingomonas bacterium]MDB5695169.1 hypothetical protein [Sphingomonas bacterium]
MMNASDATPGEASGPDVITTPHGIEIAIEAEATGRAPTGLAQVVLAEHSALLRAQRAKWGVAGSANICSPR